MKTMKISFLSNFIMPMLLAVTFKGITAVLAFIGAFFYVLNQIGLFRIMLAEKYDGSLKEYFKNKLKIKKQ